MSKQVAKISVKHRTFGLPFDPALYNTLPGARQAGGMVLLPHIRDAVKFARNRGYAVPAPIVNHYDWPADTFRTQKITAAMLSMHHRAYVLSEMGTGKTRSALHAMNWLMLEGEIEAALVVAPLSTLSQTWDREIFQYFPHLSTAVLHGSKAKRLKLLHEQHHIYIINPDGVEVILPELIQYKRIQCVLLDELAQYRNSQTNQWKSLKAMIEDRLFVWGMTGAPTPNEPADAYGQIKLLTPTRVPKYYKHFKELTMRSVSQFRWVPRPNANDIVYASMQPAVRFLRRECIELPETSYQTREVSMDPEQKRVYDGLVAKSHHAFLAGEVTALNEGVLLSKLLQVSAGWVYTTTKAVVRVGDDTRLRSLQEVLDEAGGSVLVFCEFVHVATAVDKWLRAAGYSCALIHGQVGIAERNRIFSGFQDGTGPKIIVAQPRCMSHGLTLTAANTIVWFTPTASLETYEQANARITRPGQTDKTLVVHLCGTPVERKVYTRLQNKAKTQGTLLEMFESMQGQVFI